MMGGGDHGVGGGGTLTSCSQERGSEGEGQNPCSYNRWVAGERGMYSSAYAIDTARSMDSAGIMDLLGLKTP